MTRDDVVDASGGHDKGTGELLRRVNCELGDTFCVVLSWQRMEAYYKLCHVPATLYIVCVPTLETRQRTTPHWLQCHTIATMTLRIATLHDVFAGFDVSDTSLTA